MDLEDEIALAYADLLTFDHKIHEAAKTLLDLTTQRAAAQSKYSQLQLQLTLRDKIVPPRLSDAPGDPDHN